MHGSLEIVDEPSPGGGIVKDRADARGLLGLIVEITQPRGSLLQSLQEERLHGD
jgi:hypothetical protein